MTVRISQRMLNLVYSVSRITGGLFFHPYQTMQSLIEDRQLVWLAALPTLLLAGLTLIWRSVVVPFVQIFTSCARVPAVVCGSAEVASDWVTVLMLSWQVLLLYLLFRFRWIKYKWQHDSQK